MDKGIGLSRVRIYAQNLQFTAGFLAEGCYGGGIGYLSRLSSGRLVKRACGLCMCLAGALMEVMSLVFFDVSLILFTPM